MSLFPWIQAISIMTLWGPDTTVARLSTEMAVAAVGGGVIITSLLSGSHDIILIVPIAYLYLPASLVATVEVRYPLLWIDPS